MDKNELERIWYRGLFSSAEINHIFNPTAPIDVLMKERADIILDNTRLYRLYLHKRNICEIKNIPWNFMQTFSCNHYNFFINNLPSTEMEFCSKITYGDMYAKKVNAYAYPSKDWGNFICINKGLEFFIYFMCLALYVPCRYNIPEHIIKNATRIAIRTWLGCESLDFEMDPRGKVNGNIMTELQKPLPYILSFVAGHEFSHHLLGHFKKNELINQIIWSNGSNVFEKEIFNSSQQQELDADLNSLSKPLFSKKDYNRIYNSSLLWFLMLDIAEYANFCINPSFFSGYQTHPSANNRYQNILSNSKPANDFDQKLFHTLEEKTKYLKDFISKDINENYGELYDEDIYGSIYLDLPNTEWRGKELIDRVDY